MEYNRIAGKYLNAVYKAVVTYCKNKEDAEDAVQNAFMKLLCDDKTKFTDDEHIKRWLIRAAINECKNNWLSFRRKKVVSIDDLDHDPSYEEHGEGELFNVLTSLPQNYRTALYLYYYEGCSVKEIATILSVSESNVQNRLMRGRNKLKELLKEGAWL